MNRGIEGNLNRAEAAGGRYRADIDGLRAVAVVPVVFYHFGIAPFTGGFVGVDVFFVISGFLITALIHAEMREGRFTILGFYERRVRRILPALFAVMAFTVAGSLFLLFPDALVAFAKSLIATAAFVSNFQFWSEASYFDLGASQKPLLHTWSLAVEEQFYFVFPALLWLLRKVRERVLLIALAALLALSFAASVWAVAAAPISAFYLLPFRFWELLLGSVLAVGQFAVPRDARLRAAIVLAGLGLIVWSVFALSDGSSFPGINAVPSCVGAALVIYGGSGGTNIASLALGSRVPVFIGLISYSLYLWHWPLHVFALALSPDRLSALEAAGLIALSVVLATLNWRYIERPFRGRDAFIGRRQLFGVAAAAIVAIIAVGGVFWAGNGLPQRYNAGIRAVLAAQDDHEPLQKRCFGLSPEKIAAGKLCAIGKVGGKPDFLLWGDSHADAMMPALAQAAQAAGKTGLFAARGSCPPLVGVIRKDKPDCAPFNRAVLPVALRPGIKTVFLDARWAEDTGAPPVGPDDTGNVVLTDGQGNTAPDAVFARALDRTVAALTRAGKKVVLIGPVPETQWLVPDRLAKTLLFGGDGETGPTRASVLARQAKVLQAFDAMKARYGVTLVLPHRALCSDTRCRTVQDGKPLYRDFQHLTVYGAGTLAPLFVPLFRN